MDHQLPVLVIEDEQCLLSFFKAALIQDGIRVVGASSGREALALLEGGEFAGIVSDLRIEGGVDGGEIFEWVRHNRPELSKRFLFVTGDAQAADAVRIRAETGAVFLEKPFRLRQMLNLVKQFTSRGKSYA
jgi:DNA-binding NtrC family response regulator